MKYLNKLLTDNERIVFRSRPHFLSLLLDLIKPALLLILVYAVSISLMVFWPNEATATLAGRIILVVSLWPLVLIALYWLRWSREQYVVTNRRVIQLEGVLHKNVFDSSLEKVNDVAMRQPLLGRLFDYGEIEIVTGSDVGINVLRRIAHPMEFKKAMLEAKDTYAAGMSLETRTQVIPTQTTSVQDVSAVIEQLGQLRDRGLISENEFQTKKSDLLTRL